MNLTSVARYEQYFGLPSSASFDAMLTALLPRVSRAVENYCNRTFQREAHVSSKLNGSGSAIQRLPDWPVLSVESLYLLGNSVALPLSDGLTYGYQFDDKYLYLTGACFPQGYRTVTASYTSGYTGSEDAFVPATPGPYTITPDTYGYASADLGVAYTSSGISLVKVGSSPAAGQYSFSAGVYTFAAADQGVELTLSYDYVPGDVEQATIEIVGAALAQRQQLGISSKTLRDESVTFDKNSFPKQATDKLFNYKRVLPV